MGQVIQVNGDYNIKTRDSGKIIFDTGSGVGEVRVTGNLVVEGATLTVSAEQLQVKDNIITLNYPEVGNIFEPGGGVTLTYSGIEVDRGPLLPRTAFVYNETDDSWNIGQGTALSGYNIGIGTSKLRVKEIVTNSSDGDNGDLILLGDTSPGGLVTVKGTLNYEDQVRDSGDADAIPNKAYVDRAIEQSPTYQITRQNTRAVAFDSDFPVAAEYFPIGPFTVQPSESQLAVIVDNNLVASFLPNRTSLAGLNVFTEDDANYDPLVPFSSVIQATNTDANIKFETSGSGRIQITQVVQVDNYDTVPAVSNTSTMLWAATPGTGNAGLYVRHSDSNSGKLKDLELISKRRSLLFSMIF